MCSAAVALCGVFREDDGRTRSIRMIIHGMLSTAIFKPGFGMLRKSGRVLSPWGELFKTFIVASFSPLSSQ